MNRKAVVREFCFAVLFLLLAVLLIGLTSTALRPVRTNYGAVWGPYLGEPEDSLDYLWLGSSYAYCDVNPAVIYDETRLTGYVLAGPEQTLSQTYWYLRQALETQRPSAVVLEASALHFAKYQNYTQVNVGYLPAGLNKLGAVFTASEPELRTGLLFDLYFYHSRWKTATFGELRSALAPPLADQCKGYTAVDGVFDAVGDGPFLRDVQEEAVYRANLEDLGRIASLCADRGIPLAVVFHPTYSQLPSQVREAIRADVADLDAHIRFFDWSEEVEAAGLEPSLHFYDPGHLNRAGAALFSAWLGDFLTGEMGLVPRPQTGKNAAAWAETVRFWQEGGPAVTE